MWWWQWQWRWQWRRWWWWSIESSPYLSILTCLGDEFFYWGELLWLHFDTSISFPLLLSLIGLLQGWWQSKGFAFMVNISREHQLHIHSRTSPANSMTTQYQNIILQSTVHAFFEWLLGGCAWFIGVQRFPWVFHLLKSVKGAYYVHFPWKNSTKQNMKNKNIHMDMSVW